MTLSWIWASPSPLPPPGSALLCLVRSGAVGVVSYWDFCTKSLLLVAIRRLPRPLDVQASEWREFLFNNYDAARSLLQPLVLGGLSRKLLVEVGETKEENIVRAFRPIVQFPRYRCLRVVTVFFFGFRALKAPLPSSCREAGTALGVAFVVNLSGVLSFSGWCPSAWAGDRLIIEVPGSLLWPPTFPSERGFLALCRSPTVQLATDLPLLRLPRVIGF